MDSSALVAILEHESDAAIYAQALANADRLWISAVNIHETGMAPRARRGEVAQRRMWRFLIQDDDFEIVAFDERQDREALAAFDRYGKSINSKAKLNLADRAAYALARSLNSPLLFKGDDLAATDVEAWV